MENHNCQHCGHLHVPRTYTVISHAKFKLLVWWLLWLLWWHFRTQQGEATAWEKGHEKSLDYFLLPSKLTVADKCADKAAVCGASEPALMTAHTSRHRCTSGHSWSQYFERHRHVIACVLSRVKIWPRAKQRRTVEAFACIGSCLITCILLS